LRPTDVRANFARFGLLDGGVEFLEAWFHETLATLAHRRWAVVHLDGDLYESTIEGLTHLYPNLSPGGFVIIDDYGACPPCAAAVHDYRRYQNIDEPIVTVDWTAVHWQKVELRP